MDLTEKTIAEEQAFRGRLLDVRRDSVELPNGRTSTREYVRHPGGVGVVALTEDRQVLLVRHGSSRWAAYTPRPATPTR